MSGIFGFWNLDGRPADPAVLRAMAGALAHRGPDGWGAWVRDSVALGHRMLRTTPEAAWEHQPLVERGGTRVLSADLRLDNRAELLRQLHVGESNASQLPDAGLLLRALRRWGSGVGARLLGDFAFATWEEQSRELLCVRDHFGVKPLYYFHAPGRLFAFASEIKALLLLEQVPDDIDELEVARHLLLPVQPDLSSTYYRAIRRVRPGHVLQVTSDGAQERSYWTLDPARSLVLSSDEEYAEAVRESFLEAVRCRLRCSGPVASMLSGGIDSSSITCAAAQILRETETKQPLLTFSAVYPDVPESDERPYIDAVLGMYDLAPSFFAADRVSPVGEVAAMNWYGDGASSAGNLYLNWNLYREAATAGARVVLDGFDGDSTLSHGYGWFHELGNAGRWWTLTREVKALAQHLEQPWLPAVRSWIVPYAVKPALRRIKPSWARRRREVTSSIAPPWARGLSDGFQRAVATHVAPPLSRPLTERESHYRKITDEVLPLTLSLLDAAAAAAGVEARFPFFDVRLIELCLSLPPQQKLRRGWSRFVMRQAMTGILPDEIRWRARKASVAPGFHHALRAHSEPQIAATLDAAAGLLSQYVDLEWCRDLHRKFAARTASPEEELHYWKAASLALWLTRTQGAFPARTSGGWEDSVAHRAAPNAGTTLQEV